MTWGVEFRAEARAEIEEAFAWYQRQAPGLGPQFLGAVEAAVDLIAGQPESWKLVHKDLRRVILRRFPYSLIYRVDKDRIVVIACFHARRNPKRWYPR